MEDHETFTHLLHTPQKKKLDEGGKMKKEETMEKQKRV